MKKIIILLSVFVYTSALAQNNEAFKKLELHFLKGETDSVLMVSDKILEQDSLNWLVYYYKGKSLYSKYQFFDALKNFEMANCIDSANFIIENALAETNEKIGKREEAIQLYYNQYLRDTLNLQPIVNLANLFRKNKEHGSAVHYYRKASMIDTSNFYYYKQQGYCIDKINLPGPAISAYEYALYLNPHDLFVYQHLANIYNSERQFENAIRTSKRGLKYYPLDKQLMKIKAYAHYLNKDFDTAIVKFTELLEYGDSTAFAFKYRGLCYVEKQFYVDAIHDLKWAYEDVETDPEVCFFLGSAYARSNQLKDGLFYLNKATRLLAPPRNETANISSEIANIFIKQEKYQEAIAMLRIAYKNDSKPIYSFRMGQVYDFYLNNKKMAIDCYEGYLTMVCEPDTSYEAPSNVDSFLVNKEVVKSAKERIQALNEELFFELGKKE